jgi:ribosomal protein S18 acetylase RimI-like enzyme
MELSVPVRDAMNALVQAGPGDLPGVLALLRNCVAGMLAAGIDQWDEVYPSAEKLSQDIAEGSLFARREGGSLQGVVALDSRQDPEYAAIAWRYPEASAGIVHRLMVAPEFQGRGLAKEMMRGLEDKARQRGLRSIRLDAFTLNPPALRLYRSLGYRETGLIRLRKGIFQCFEKELSA